MERRKRHISTLLKPFATLKSVIKLIIALKRLIINLKRFLAGINAWRKYEVKIIITFKRLINPKSLKLIKSVLKIRKRSLVSLRKWF